MLTFDSLASLKSYSVAGIPLNESCNLLGYNQPTDGGGGFFITINILQKQIMEVV